VKTSKARTKIKQHIRSIGDIPVKSILPEVEKKQELEAWIIKVENMSNPEIKLARCCKPLPGNKIIGYSTKTEKVSVHKKECELTEKYEGGTRRKKVPVSWIEDLETNVVIHVHAEDRTGVFAEILNSLLAIKIQIKNAKAKAIDMGSVECSFLMEVHGIPELQETIERIKKIQSVKQVYISESK
jgi:GTP diphosphokinase / guanosine-3',5'-bis(diphosphate) 3'-diphosphatase